MFRIVLILYFAMSIVTFALYGLDKRAARRNRRRTPEATLHLFGLCGGWPGALAAQQLFRHKRRKRAFVIVTVLIALLHTAVWIAVALDVSRA